jgi:hypothetical protein
MTSARLLPKQLALTLFAILLTSCKPSAETANVSPAMHWQRSSPNVRAVHRAYIEAQQQQLLNGQFDALEAEAASPSLASFEALGLPGSRVFFDGFDFSDWQKTPDWPRYFEQIDAWAKSHPDSIYPPLARSIALKSYAWEARGDGYADSVSENGWKLYAERLDLAFQNLKKIAAQPGTKPAAFWVNYLTVARGLNAPADHVLQVAEAAVAEHPDDAGIYSNICVYLLPRWHGKPGQWEKWLQKQSTGNRWNGNPMSAKLYAYIIWRVFSYGEDVTVFEDKTVSWPKTLEGLNALCAEYPDSIYWKSSRAKLAWVARDQDAFIRALDAMGGKFDSWSINPKELEEALRWAGKKDSVQP